MRSSLFLVMLLLAPAFVCGAQTNFDRTLRLGMRGEDVRALQVVLNADPDTRVATTGAGSLGQETDYFGPATKRALVKFQEKHRDEVLAPVGLVNGTGIFGEKTRAKVSAVRQSLGALPALAVTAPIRSGNSTVPTVPPVVNFLSAYSGVAGTIIEISGEHFAARNSVYFGDFEVKDVASAGGTKLRVEVPAIAPGVYAIRVGHEKGKSSDDRIFAVTKAGATAPVIKTIAPEKVKRGGSFVLTGSGFSQKNIVRSGIGDLAAELQADGSIRVTVPGTVMPFVPKGTSGASTPAYLYVLNENGMSEVVRFTLEL